MKKTIYLLIILVPFLTQCKKTLTGAELKRWIEDPKNGLVKEYTGEGFKLQCIYQPVDFLISNALRKPNITRQEYAEEKKTFEGWSYFNLKIYMDHEPDYETKEYLNYGMQENIKLVVGTDTIPCALYHAEPWNGVTPYQTVLTAFSADILPADNFSVVLLDGASKLACEFSYRGTEVRSIPKLKL